MQPKEIKENLVNLQRQQSAVDRIKRGLEYIQKELTEIPKSLSEIKDVLIAAIKKLFGVRPSDKTLYKYRELWQREFIKQNERVLTNVVSPKVVIDENLEPCHTPNDVAYCIDETANALQENAPRESAISPLHMKVKVWVSEQVRLIYQGNGTTGLVDIVGEKRSKIRLIGYNQQVIITDHAHSSFLFHPDDEERLKVYVKPLSNAHHWLTGIPVLAKYLQLVPDG